VAARTKKKKTATKKTSTTATKPKPKRSSRATVTRLERGEGDARSFWEISRSQSTITTRFGRHLNAGRTVTKDYGTKPSAEAALTKAIEEKRAEGYSDPAPKQIIGGSSCKGVSTRNPELEALIEEDPSDLQRYLVYADWLQQQSDPRGELIVAQHGLETSTDNDELDSFEHIEKELLKQFGDELLGKLSTLLLVRPAYKNPQRGLAWRCGFLRAARVQIHNERLSNQEAIELLLTHPSGRFLEVLGIGNGSLSDVCLVLAGKMPKTLTTLVISNPWAPELTLEPLRTISSGLRRLWITGSIANVGLDVVDGLEELDIALADPGTLVAIAKTTWPTLKRVHLTLSVIHDIDVGTVLTDILRCMPALEHLTLRRWLVGQTSSDIQNEDVLARSILDVFKKEKTKVTRLDLEMAVSKFAAEEDLLPLLREVPRSIRIHLPKRAVQDPVMRSVYASELKVVFVEEDPEQRMRDDINPFHHTKASL
jgi:uncharacterized protein (TIGR02996 family)